MLQQQQIVSVRDFLRGFAKITSKPQKKVYTVVKNGEEVGYFIPKKHANEVLKNTGVFSSDEKKYNGLDVFDDFRFSSGDPNLSMKVDEIVYGVSRTD